nr:RNA-directed DNA polymerase, eukaryota [Tanacetum cinerariifolium]
MESMELCSVKTCWDNFAFDYVHSDSVGNSRGIMCVWDPNSFHIINTTISDYFIMIRGVWLKTGVNLLVVAVYAPRDMRDKRMLWDYLAHVINKWDGEVVTMGDFNEVRYKSDRFGLVFNVQGADVFNSFIANAGLVEVPLGGSSFTWCHKSATKMSKLDRFLISKNLLITCPNISATTLDRYLSDHRPILLRETQSDYGEWWMLECSWELSYAGMFMGIKLSPSLNLSHMFYADDAVIVGQWCDGNINTLVYVLECFYRVSGLRINMSKSKIMGVHVEDEKVKYAASKLRCLILNTPFSYLGTKVGGSMSRVQAWKEVVDKVKSRLSNWKMKALSIGGGLGVSSLYALNRGLMLKWVWRFYSQKTSLWARVIKAIYGDNGKVGKALETCKSVTVSKKLTDSNLDNSFRRKTRGGVEQVQYNALSHLVHAVTFVPLFDRWVWSLESSEEFSVASVRKVIDEKRLLNVNTMTRWIKCVPIKVNVLAWKIKIDALPMRLNISCRGIDIDSILYPICDCGVESSSHLFFSVVWPNKLLARFLYGGM